MNISTWMDNIKKRLTIDKKYQELQQKHMPKTAEWFFSAEGKRAYESATDLSKKIEFFRSYITALTYGQGEYIRTAHTTHHMRENQENFLRNSFGLAYILACAVDGTDLPYGRYPEILRANINPLVGFAQDNKKVLFEADSKAHKTLCLMLIGALRGRSADDMRNAAFAYKDLTPLATNKALHRLEREILGVFCYVPDSHEKDRIFFFEFSNKLDIEALEAISE